MATKLTIVFPCYNSGQFISQSFAVIDNYLTTKDDIHVMFIEDCGKDNTYQTIIELVNASSNKEKYIVKKNELNKGKGGTIKRGVAECTTELMVFTDPDLAYDLSNIDFLYKSIKPKEMLIANRVHQDSRYLVPPFFFRYIITRHLSSRIFNKLAQIILIPGIEDNQAGLKMFYVNDIKPLLSKSIKNDFSFDVELLVMANENGIKIKGMPVNFKYEYEPSTVAFISDSFRMLGSLLRIFFLRIRNHYKVS